MADRRQTRRGVKTLKICMRDVVGGEGEGVVMRGGLFSARSGGLTRREGTSGEGGRHEMLWADSELLPFGQ